MHRVTLPHLRARAWRRTIGLSVLLAVLVLQVQVALAGCLVASSEPAVAVMADMSDGCDQGVASVMRACMQHCEQVSEAPPSSDANHASDLLVALLPNIRVPELTYLGIDNAATRRVGQPPPDYGPPLYLRLLHLLN